MNAPLSIERLLPSLDHKHLDWLEEEAIFILREVVAGFERPALLFSGGKDSCVVLRLAEKAFKTRIAGNHFKGKLPFPLLHVDTGHNFPEVIEFRDRRVAEMGERLVVGHLEDSIRRGTVRLSHPLESRNGHQTVALLEAIEEHRFDCLIGGARKGANLQPPRRLRPMAAQGTAARAVDAVQHPHPPGRTLPRLPDQQLDRTGRVAVPGTREHPAARAVLRA